MEDNILWKGGVRVHMDKVLTDTDSPNPNSQRSLDYLHTVLSGRTSDVYRFTASVCAIAAAAFCSIPFHGAVGAIQNQRDTGDGTEGIKALHKLLVHILKRARRGASLELGLLEILCGNHIISFSW